MDATDLLAREHEFKKLNKQLEKKTESLMKEIENVMQKQDIFSEFSTTLLQSPAHSQKKKHNCDTPKLSTPEKQKTILKDKRNDPEISIEKPKHNCSCCILLDNKKNNDDLDFLYAFVSVNVKDNVLPQSLLKDKITVESVCKFLSAKVKLMQEQIDKLQCNIEKKAKQCNNHMSQLAEYESEKMKLLNQANCMKADTADAKAKYLVVANKLSEKDRLYKEQRSVTDKLTSDIKQIKTKNISLEARCASQEETISNLKQQVDLVKMAEKEFRDSARNNSTSQLITIKNLENKIKKLISHIHKQDALTENLKKQIVLLQTEGAMRVLEKDYCEFLNQVL